MLTANVPKSLDIVRARARIAWHASVLPEVLPDPRGRDSLRRRHLT
jgi:hypothetical protein